VGKQSKEWVAANPLFFMEMGDMERGQIAKVVEEILEPIAVRMGVEVVDVELTGTGGKTILRVLVDRPGGITVEECAQVSEALGRQLDILDLIPHAYTLEVSSPGLDRPLKKDRDFAQFAGRKVEITTYAPVKGRRKFKGILRGLVQGEVILDLEGAQVTIPRKAIAQAKLVVELEDLWPDLKV